MSDKKRFLVIGVLQSQKNSKYYASGRFWSTDKHAWLGQKNRKTESYGDALVEISEDIYQILSQKVYSGSAVIVDAVVDGFNDFNFPIWSLQITK